MPELVIGNLLNAKVDVIVQQCNCVTIKPHGLSEQISKKYPYANIYKKRIGKSSNTALKYDIPGTCIISKAENMPTIAALLCQIGPGKPFKWASIYKFDPQTDSPLKRLEYFEMALQALNKICKDENYKTVAFPFNIGCGLAGGNWNKYLKLIVNFELYSNLKIFIYQL